jgi:hypothetical protein
MHLHENHSWCSNSHWDGELYDCRYIVCIDKYNRVSDAEESDFLNLVETYSFVIDDEVFGNSFKSILCLRSEVFNWLLCNIPDCRSKKGWCIGDDRYRSTSSVVLRIFFDRKRDALSFIREWSEHKKPTTYYNHFRGESMELINGNLEIVKSDIRT